MQVFITGGTGLIGSAVVAELITGGHSVVALARSDSSAAAAESSGAAVVRGGLADLDVIRSASAAADGAIHLAFGNDFSTQEALQKNIAEESAAIDTIVDTLAGSNRPFVVVSGTPSAEGRPSVEADPLPTTGPVGGRSVTVERTLTAASRGIRTASVRLPRTVHKDGDGGFAGLLTNMARQGGVAAYPGTGEQRWPAVHALDAAVLFRLVLENAEPGTAWHAVQDEGDTVRSIVEVIARRLGLPVQQAPVETFGPIGPVFAADQPASSAHTRRALGWVPTHARLLEDLELLQP
ncbi:NAD-dependent epimerase/dehydratase family protein [Curtobacterium sp. ISL-83]|uniref:NAD-dependent epimerase/dehydratase family protein n=1 Tax=Curtobacterium sp. ISL-83 TaxID=2819145 RepID=UPI001BE8C1D8|nr:NAD-dependent epimerase/dehydratase family protein [Curtobacterium sp. ISL-83]MBT2504108.1 NAD-dependent epimerase/dehydratase family protein [Curtobacterium sp. ISL-83]